MYIWPFAQGACLGLAVVCVAAATAQAIRGVRNRKHRRSEVWLIALALLLACIGFFGETIFEFTRS